MEEYFFRKFSSTGHNGFLNDASIAFINNTDPANREFFWRKILKTITLYGLSIDVIV